MSLSALTRVIQVCHFTLTNRPENNFGVPTNGIVKLQKCFFSMSPSFCYREDLRMPVFTTKVTPSGVVGRNPIGETNGSFNLRSGIALVTYFLIGKITHCTTGLVVSIICQAQINVIVKGLVGSKPETAIPIIL